MIIGVTGQMGAGKTLTAQLLSKCLDAKLIELDSYIHSLYKEEKVKKFLMKFYLINLISLNLGYLFQTLWLMGQSFKSLAKLL
jgi:uridine kinase